MSLDQLKEKVVELTAEERRQLIAFMVALETEQDRQFQAELACNPAYQCRPCRLSLSLAIVGCAMVLALAGCSPKAKSAALGKWQVKDSKEAMEFRSDGTCQGSDSDGRVVSGTFAFLDRVVLMLRGLSGSRSE